MSGLTYSLSLSLSLYIYIYIYIYIYYISKTKQTNLLNNFHRLQLHINSSAFLICCIKIGSLWNFPVYSFTFKIITCVYLNTCICFVFLSTHVHAYSTSHNHQWINRYNINLVLVPLAATISTKWIMASIETYCWWSGLIQTTEESRIFGQVHHNIIKNNLH